MEEKEVEIQNSTVIEKLVLHGDLSALGPKERVAYYTQLCDYLGLSPVTQPFKIIKLQGKDTLYATKDATEQLRKKWGVSVDSITTATVKDVYIVTVKGHDAKGRTDMATGVVTIGDAHGDTLANALMKAETKAKRRFTLSICGLGVLDETEIETIPNAVHVKEVTQETVQEAEDLRQALLVYIDEQKILGHMTGKQHNDAHVYIIEQPSDVDRLSEVAAMYADKCGEFVEGDDKQTGPTNDEIAEEAFRDDIF